MTQEIELGAALRQTVLDVCRLQAQAIVDAAKPATIGPKVLVFFAAFDGTNNDMDNVGNNQNTNAAQLFKQAQAGEQGNPGLKANYYPGPGTKGTLTKSAWLSKAVTGQVTATAEKAYADFAGQASAWLELHPDGSVTAALTAFSRGVASAAIFCQLLNEKGLTDPSDPATVLAPPGAVKVAAGVLFDPVATGVEVNVAFPPDAGNLVSIRAQDDYRQLFKAVNYSGQRGVKTIAMLGNHCDIGGGYDNGIAALTLQAATDFFRRSGVRLGDVADGRKFGGVNFIAIHTEEFDDTGAPQWDVYPPGFVSAAIKDPSPRLFAHDIIIKDIP